MTVIEDDHLVVAWWDDGDGGHVILITMKIMIVLIMINDDDDDDDDGDDDDVDGYSGVNENDNNDLIVTITLVAFQRKRKTNKQRWLQIFSQFCKMKERSHKTSYMWHDIVTIQIKCQMTLSQYKSHVAWNCPKTSHMSYHIVTRQVTCHKTSHMSLITVLQDMTHDFVRGQIRCCMSRIAWVYQKTLTTILYTQKNNRNK